MKRARSGITYLRGLMIAVGLLLPLLSLIPLGSIWLWQQGYLLYWALAACLTTICVYLAQLWLLHDVPRQDASADTDAARVPGADPSWTAGEAAAWNGVRQIAAAVRPDALSSTDAATAIGLRTVEAVALSLHPEVRDPLWQFTAPEALAVIERVSGRMRVFIDDNVPLGDRLTVAQVLRLYRWRGVIGVAETAYDIWRTVRVLNPVTAATQELREQLSKRMLEWGKEHLAKRLAEAYVEEVGRAAIDLYGGRLRVSADRLADHVSQASERDAAAMASRMSEPIRILVAGQVSAGKSSLVNALANEIEAAVDALPATAAFTPYELKREGLPSALLIDSPGVGQSPAQRNATIEKAQDCDLVLWVCAAHRADREIDRAALAALRQHFEARTNRRRPPTILVLTNIDRLRPFKEWNPPYDLTQSSNGKAASIRAAVEAAGGELGFAEGDIVPVCLAEDIGRYNIDAVWGKIIETLPEAQRTQLVRCLRDAEGAWDWKRMWSQAKSGGRVLVRTVLR